MERGELKEAIVRDLNSEDYPFIVEVRGNTVIGRWKVKETAQDVDEKRLRAFYVKYKLRKSLMEMNDGDGRFKKEKV